MGWASGSELADKVWDAVRAYLPLEKRQQIAMEVVLAFEDHDCDTMDEAEQLMKDAGLKQVEVVEDEWFDRY